MDASVVRNVNGSLTRQVFGIAVGARTRKYFSAVAGPSGTLSTPAVCARVAVISGAGRPDYAVLAGRYTKTGTQRQPIHDGANMDVKKLNASNRQPE